MTCKLAALPLPDEDRALLEQWTKDGTDKRDRRVSGDAMTAALRAEGHVIGPTTVKDHKAGRCACRRG